MSSEYPSFTRIPSQHPWEPALSDTDNSGLLRQTLTQDLLSQPQSSLSFSYTHQTTLQSPPTRSPPGGIDPQYDLLTIWSVLKNCKSHFLGAQNLMGARAVEIDR